MQLLSKESHASFRSLHKPSEGRCAIFCFQDKSDPIQGIRQELFQPQNQTMQKLRKEAMPLLSFIFPLECSLEFLKLFDGFKFNFVSC